MLRQEPRASFWSPMNLFPEWEYMIMWYYCCFLKNNCKLFSTGYVFYWYFVHVLLIIKRPLNASCFCKD